MTDYKALCAELLAVFDNYDDESNLVGIFDDMKANKIDLLDRARLALAPVTLADREVADPVIPCEYAGYLAAAYRNGFHAGYKHALTRAPLAPQPVPKGPTNEELWKLEDDMGGSPEDSLWCRKYARAVLARWGQP